jgi:hypothetical protein
MKRKYGAWFYVGYVLMWAVVIVVGSTIAGAVLFPLARKAFGSERAFGELALLGARYFAEWTGKVWALSIALVLAFNHAYHHRAERRGDQRGASSDS